MADTPLRIWTLRAAYPAIAFVVIFFQILPTGMMPRQVSGPDLIVALTFAWALRRPEAVPVLSIALVMLLADLIFQRPPGLWAALTIVMAESLKARERRQRETAFVMEMVTVSAALIVMMLIYQIALLVLIVPIANWTLMITQTIMTIIAYPAVVAVSRLLFGVSRKAPGDPDRLGLGL